MIPILIAYCLVGPLKLTDGQRLMDGDFCNACTCEDGAFGCTEMECSGTKKPEGCLVAGYWMKVAETYGAADGCNACTCQKDGDLSCTKKACKQPKKKKLKKLQPK